MANEIRPSAAAELTLLPKERPLAAEMRSWLEDALTRLPPDQRALVMGVEPQGVIAFDSPPHTQRFPKRESVQSPERKRPIVPFEPFERH